MLSKHEINNIILYERKRLVDIVDPVERKCVLFICLMLMLLIIVNLMLDVEV
jgi:hypothetical protein